MFWYPQFVYVTALFPYVILLTLLVRAATLPGFLDGVTYYITPQWGRILDFNVSLQLTCICLRSRPIYPNVVR